MRALTLVLRRSTSIIAGFLIAAVSVSLALASRGLGLNLWTDLTTGLSSASLFTGTLAAGCAAHEASRWEYASRERDRLASRAPSHVRAVHLFAVIGPLVGAFPLTLGVLSVYAGVTHTYGSPHVPWMFALAGALCLASAFGYLVGIRGRGRWFIAPASALLFYGLFVVSRLVPLSYGAGSLYPVIARSDSVFVSYVDATMWGQSAFFVGVAAVGFCLLGVTRPTGSRTTQRVLLGVAVGVAAVGAMVVLSLNGQYTNGHNSRDFECASGGSTICVNRGYAAALPLLTEQVAQLNARASGTPLEAQRLEQNVEGVGDDPAPGARSLYIEQISPSDIRFALMRYVTKYGG